MQLPGGVVRAGRRHRGFSFAPLTGEVELAVAEAWRAPTTPAAVTAALAAALDDLGGQPATVERVAALAVGDRQFLARRLAVELGRDARWLVATCPGCGDLLDVVVRASDLPVKEAGPGFPVVEVPTAAGPVRLRVPSGADQEAVVDLADDAAAEVALLRRCIVDGDVDPTWPAGRDDDARRAEAALEDAAPEVGLTVVATCPGCDAPVTVEVDAYTPLRDAVADIAEDLHTLALHYHWSEADSLRLPRHRRRWYVARLERALGVVV
jgi:hypothetical protein